MIPLNKDKAKNAKRLPTYLETMLTLVVKRGLDNHRFSFVDIRKKLDADNALYSNRLNARDGAHPRRVVQSKGPRPSCPEDISIRGSLKYMLLATERQKVEAFSLCMMVKITRCSVLSSLQRTLTSVDVVR